MKNLTIKESQQKVDQWIKTVGGKYFDILTQLAQLTEETGEVARVISRTYGQQSFKKSDKQKILADELADVLFVLICIANQTKIDLNQAFLKNLAKKTKRDKKRHLRNKKIK